MAKGWTQTEAGERLAKFTGRTLSKASWSAYEAQTRPCSWRAEDLAALSLLFEVTLDELFADMPEPRSCPTCGQDVPA
jgi:hypothetical protein